MSQHASADQPTLLDEVLAIRVDQIDPDPEQPRLEVDDELAASIEQHGVLKPIEIRPHPAIADRWMIRDGERRWRGAKAAKQLTVPCIIRLDTEGLNPADRLIKQIVANEGKPLTPVEEALAFKRIIDARREAGDKKYGITQLAQELGKSKSTVSDRLTLTEIPAFWLDLIAKGPLQPSHAPQLYRWRKVPEKYQRQALEQIKKDYRWSQRRGGADERIYVDVLKTMLETYMYKFVKPVQELIGYQGPTEVLTTREYPHKRLAHAMDPSQWMPLYRKAVAEKKAKEAKSGGGKKAKEAKSGGGKKTDWKERQRQEEQRWERERKAREAKQAAWNAAVPAIADATAAALRTSSEDLLLALITDAIIDHYRRKAIAPLLESVAADAPLVRLAMAACANMFIDGGWNAGENYKPIAKRLGLDLKTVVKGTAPDPAVPAEQPGVCRYCGCTEANACEGGCSWVSRDPWVCSTPECVEKADDDGIILEGELETELRADAAEEDDEVLEEVEG